MASRRHDLLNISASEDESDHGYDSGDNVTESKGRAVKRRRTADNQDPFGLDFDEGDSDISEGEEEEESRLKRIGRMPTKRPATDEDEEGLDDEDESANLEDQSESINKSKGKLLNKKLAKLASGKPPKKDKSGVIYLSSLPPYLKPVSYTYSALKKSHSNMNSSLPSRICWRSETSVRSQRFSLHLCNRQPLAKNKSPISANSTPMVGSNSRRNGKFVYIIALRHLLTFL